MLPRFNVVSLKSNLQTSVGSPHRISHDEPEVCANILEKSMTNQADHSEPHVYPYVRLFQRLPAVAVCDKSLVRLLCGMAQKPPGPKRRCLMRTKRTSSEGMGDLLRDSRHRRGKKISALSDYAMSPDFCGFTKLIIDLCQFDNPEIPLFVARVHFWPSSAERAYWVF